MKSTNITIRVSDIQKEIITKLSQAKDNNITDFIISSIALNVTNDTGYTPETKLEIINKIYSK